MVRVSRVARARRVRVVFSRRATARARSDAAHHHRAPLQTLTSLFPKTRPRVLFLLARGMRGLFACFDTKLNDTGIQSRKMLYSVDFWDFVERDFRRFFPSDAAFSESHTVVFPVLRFRKITARFLESHTVVFVDFRWCYKSTTRKCFRRVVFVVGIAAARLILPDARTRASPVRSRSRTFRVRVALEPHSCA